MEVYNTTAGSEIPFPSSNGEVGDEDLTISKRPDETFGNVTAGPNINGTVISYDTDSSAEPEGPVSDGVEREEGNITAPSFVKVDRPAAGIFACSPCVAFILQQLTSLNY